MSGPRIEPRTLKGFRDYPPAAMIPRERLVDTARRVYRSFGFAPIDTPALEYAEVLLGKGGDEADRQAFRFEDHGGRQVALRFDLTVPLARFAAQHAAELGTPFKRYHIAPVWRGEKPQRGRFREFLQCDFDTIGTESLAADAETALVIHELLVALGFEDFRIQINNRKVLSGVLERLGIAERSALVLRALDKLGKVGPEKAAQEMVEAAGVTRAQADEVLRLAELEGADAELLRGLAPLVAGSETGERGVAELETVLTAVRAAGVPPERLRVDVSIARGLDYYTGTVFETLLGALPGIGSVCSGGRYDDLAGLYTKLRLPGIGASLGVDRLLAAMEELGMLPATATVAPVYLVLFDEARLGEHLALATRLRRAGLCVELSCEARKLGAQLKTADRRGFRFAVVVGPDEQAAGAAQVKDLRGGEGATLPQEELAAWLSQKLSEGGAA